MGRRADGSIPPMPRKKLEAQPDKPVDTIMQTGQIVDGKYRVDHLLGQGGMAAVWAGTNERTGKRVALKVILRSLATTREAEHLVYSEALAASRVNHPNVVTVFDVIEHEGMACIVMELLDGEPLGTYIARKGYLTVSEATSLLLPAMRGVAAANAQGVVHRDLKPQNIFICIGPDGRALTTKVLDFGISVMMERVVDRSAGPNPVLALGTPAYMAPEHILGERRIDERADVYGFGVLLYEALSGQMPFPGEPGSELYQRILREPAPPLTLIRPDLPPGLVRIIGVAMAKEPDHRYSDLNLMVNALEDELLPHTPAPFSLATLTGMPSFPLAGQSLMQALKRGPSVQHQETRMLFAFPLRTENEGSAADSGSNSGSNDGSEAKAPPTARDRTTALLHLRPPLRKTLFRLRALAALRARLAFDFRPKSLAVLGDRALSVLRSRRGLAGVGVAVALVFASWMAMRGAGHARRSAPPTASPTSAANTLAAPLPVPTAVPTAIVVPVESPTPVTDPPSPPASGAPAAAAHSKSKRHVRGTPVARARSREPRAGALMKSAAPRAGKLSADDF